MNPSNGPMELRTTYCTYNFDGKTLLDRLPTHACLRQNHGNFVEKRCRSGYARLKVTFTVKTLDKYYLSTTNFDFDDSEVCRGDPNLKHDTFRCFACTRRNHVARPQYY